MQRIKSDCSSHVLLMAIYLEKRKRIKEKEKEKEEKRKVISLLKKKKETSQSRLVLHGSNGSVYKLLNTWTAIKKIRKKYNKESHSSKIKYVHNPQ